MLYIIIYLLIGFVTSLLLLANAKAISGHGIEEYSSVGRIIFGVLFLTFFWLPSLIFLGLKEMA